MSQHSIFMRTSVSFGLSLALGAAALLACSSQSDNDTGNAANNASAGGSAGTAAGGTSTAGSGVGGATVGAAGSVGTAGTTAAGGQPQEGAGGTAGAGGAAQGGTAGAAQAGAAGAAGGGALGDDRSGPSAGCNGQVNDPIDEDIEHAILGDRLYWTRLPEVYDGTNPVPVVFYGPGCGIANNVEGAPLDGSIRQDAMRVFLVSTGGCFDTGGDDSPEPEYFATALAEIEANYCTDLGKVFVSGYSSGGWLTNMLACAHGDKIRAIGTAAGGMPDPSMECVGRVAAIMHAGVNDNDNPIVNINDEGVDRGSGAARDRLLAANHCTQETQPWGDFGFCAEYQGCDPGYEVVWCEENTGHSNGGAVSAQGWWQFWSNLP